MQNSSLFVRLFRNRPVLPLVTGFLVIAAGASAKDPAPTSPLTISERALDRATKLSTSFAPMIKKAAPSVVNIYSTRVVRNQPDRSPMEDDPFFRRFFGSPQENDSPRSRRERGLGSGVIVTSDGYILTANHVVEGADEVKVAIADGNKEYIAKVVGTDPPTDIAVLKVDGKDMPAVTLTDSDKLEVGDMVIAIGNPFGVGQTVTMGIVSALGRGGFGINGYEDFIQTDAAINPGNSGGALVDAEGRLVGVNTAIISGSGGYQGIGFAVPVNMARRALERIMTGGKISRGYLGVSLQDLTPALSQQFQAPVGAGVLVTFVDDNTPAKKAGIKADDVITEVNGKKIRDRRNLQLMISQIAPGTKVQVKVLRNGEDKTFNVVLGELPEEIFSQSTRPNRAPAEEATADALDGVAVADLTPRFRRQMNLPADLTGALVARVDPDSNAQDAGLQVRDVITAVNRTSVKDADDAVALCKKSTGDQIVLKVWRRMGPRSQTIYLTVDNTKDK